ncbi:mobile mystery protein A [bacterium]|nr:mobile mystery protein A [bacterium]
MLNSKHIAVQNLDSQIKGLIPAAQVEVPKQGWIKTIRSSLNMTMVQLGKRLGITRQGVRQIEKSEVSGGISLKSLNEVAEAMNLKLVYGFVPKTGSFEELIQERANALAESIVMRAYHNMVLEDQGPEQDHIQKSITQLAKELKEELHKSLWD